MLEEKNILRFNDVWKGKNYGLLPVSIEGKKLKDRFQNSDKWKLISQDNKYTEKNDKQIDIYRGSVYIFQNVEDESKIVTIICNSSRSGKNVQWIFKLSFEEEIDF